MAEGLAISPDKELKFRCESTARPPEPRPSLFACQQDFPAPDTTRPFRCLLKLARSAATALVFARFPAWVYGVVEREANSPRRSTRAANHTPIHLRLATQTKLLKDFFFFSPVPTVVYCTVASDRSDECDVNANADWPRAKPPVSFLLPPSLSRLFSPTPTTNLDTFPSSL